MAHYIENETTRFNGYYLMDSEKSETGFVIVGVRYPDANEVLIDISSISDDFVAFDGEQKAMYDCGLRVCTRYNTLQAAYFALLMATRKGVA